MTNCLVFSLTSMPTQPLSEYLFHRELQELGLDSKFALFSFDQRLKQRTTDSLVHPRSFGPLQQESIKVSASRFNLLKSRDLKYHLRDVDYVLTRQVGKKTDQLVVEAVKAQKHPIKRLTYVMNTVGASIGWVPPDIYLCPGNFWERLLKEGQGFLTGLKKFDFPFAEKQGPKFKGEIVKSGLLAWLEVKDSLKNVSREQFLKAYGIKNRFIVICLESSPKYIDQQGHPRSKLLDFTFEIINKLEDSLGSDYDILIKGHPFQYQKPYPWYKRKQLSLDIFVNRTSAKIVRADDGYHAFHFADFVMMWNSSVCYEVALCGAKTVIVAEQESDFVSRDGLFSGGFFTPEIYGFIFSDYAEFERQLPQVLAYQDEERRLAYLKEYGDMFDSKVVYDLIISFSLNKHR